MKRLMWVGVVGVAALLTATVAEARGPGKGMHGMGPGGPGAFGPGLCPRAMAQLDLTDQQKRQIDGLKEQMEQEMKPVHDAMRAKHEEMAALWSVDSPSEAAILAKADEVDALHKQARNRGIRFGLEVVNVLTPAQRQQLATLRAQGPGACGGPGMGPPPDGDDDRGRRGPRGRVRMGG